MSIRIKCVIIVVLILGLLKILGLIKRNKLELKYALSWLFLELGILIITLIPNLLNVISKVLGIYNEINMLFFLGFVFIILVIFSLTMSLSRNSERVRKMAQEIALNSYANNKKNGWRQEGSRRRQHLKAFRRGRPLFSPHHRAYQSADL